MAKTIDVEYLMGDEILVEARGLGNKANEAVQTLKSGKLAYTGWVDYAGSRTEDYITQIENMAREIRYACDVLVVIGIGGSYLGAKAAIDFIDRAESKLPGDHPAIEFAGFNLSGTYHAQLINRIKNKDVCLLIISKSGGTVEPSMAFITLKALLRAKYGEAGVNRRIYAVTDAENGKLRSEATAMGYETLALPSDIGGRFSVLTPVGLLPLAAAGIDIRQILDGAKSSEGGELLEAAKKLACVRKILGENKQVQAIDYFEPSLEAFTAWMMQLFGESEGKEGKGTLPVGVGISRDLHSLGQFLQEGNQIFYETLLYVKEATERIGIAESEDALYAGRTYSEFNRAVLEGVVRAHRQIDIPIVKISLPDTSAYSFGQLVYFFEMACAVTGLLMGVNPFDQPGVEAYKKGMLDFLAN